MNLSPEEIAERFDISLAAANVRAKELERMRRRSTGQIRQLPPSVVDFLREQKRKGFLVTSLKDEDGKT